MREEETRRAGASLGGASLRGAVLLALGVLVLQFAFIWSYVGALHNPAPHQLPVAVVGPEALIQQLRAATGDTLRLVSEPNVAAAQQAIDTRRVYGAFLPSPNGDQLTVADAAGPAAVDALTRVLTQFEKAQGRQLGIVHTHALPASDAQGLTPFYLVLGWVVGGELLAVALALIRGAWARTFELALIRLGGFALYAIAAAILGVLLVEGVFGIWHDFWLRLAALGVLIVFGTAAATAALQAAFGLVGTGLAILFFLVLGNPSSGGPFARDLLPTFWRTIGPYLPPGAGTDAVRNLLYFDAHGLARPLAVLAVYAVAGALLTLALGVLRRRLARPRVRASLAPVPDGEPAG
ncbi:MAG TPA: hypothetical protein VFI42_10675 [Thermomicrobiaceae bacterium]|nr:hypothetical protein [Thermomicrobiaceae bacterium]